MKKAYLVLATVLIVIAFFFSWQFFSKNKFAVPTNQSFFSPTPKPLLKYTIENLSKTKIQPSQITIGDKIKDDGAYTSRYFFFDVGGKKVSGLVNLPKTPGNHPVIVMLRGYVDREIYTSGIGTQRAGEVFAQNGFITLAPDFLGYGKSDQEASNSIESRFQTYTTTLTLLNSISNLNSAMTNLCHSEQSEESNEQINRSFDPFNGSQDDKICENHADATQVGIWGHSNGGQIALTVLETTGKLYPTVLWAPVSKPFPYSILYYTDDFDDRGKALRKVIADFEKDYDVELYSLPNYLQNINAPIQLHQGTADDAVPVKWSDTLNDSLKKLDQEIQYFTYPGADHNLQGGWNTAVERSLNFYNKLL